MSSLILQQKQESLSLVQKMESVTSRIQVWMDRHSQRRQLAKLDARQLDDMGLNLKQVEQEIQKPFWQ